MPKNLVSWAFFCVNPLSQQYGFTYRMFSAGSTTGFIDMEMNIFYQSKSIFNRP